MTTYWFMNTDEDAIKDLRTCDLWFAHGMAFSGEDWKKYGLPLQNLNPRDILLMYHNGVGIVGAGRVLEAWDKQPYSSKLLYKDFEFSEYRLRVDWHIDLRTTPIDPRREFGYNPSRFLQSILKHRAVAESLISRAEMSAEFRSPEEITASYELKEGESRTVAVDVHERNPIARRNCIERWGTTCQVCGFAFDTFYGPVGQDYIHVHHLVPLGGVPGPRSVDPINDLRPVCANCHAMIHKKNPPYSIEEVVGFIEIQKKG